MKLVLTHNELASYLSNQMDRFFPDGRDGRQEIDRYLPDTLGRVEHCFSHICMRYFNDNGDTNFDHLNTDQYAAFLYLFGNTVYRAGGSPSLFTKAYALNKALHGLDVFPAVALPDIFYFVHPVGTVIGRAEFENYFCIYQNCSVGGDVAEILPKFGKGVVMYAGSRVIGESTVGANCLIATGTVILNSNVPDNTVSFGQHPNVVSRPTRHNVIEVAFGLTERQTTSQKVAQ